MKKCAFVIAASFYAVCCDARAEVPDFSPPPTAYQLWYCLPKTFSAGNHQCTEHSGTMGGETASLDRCIEFRDRMNGQIAQHAIANGHDPSWGGEWSCVDSSTQEVVDPPRSAPIPSEEFNRLMKGK